MGNKFQNILHLHAKNMRKFFKNKLTFILHATYIQQDYTGVSKQLTANIDSFPLAATHPAYQRPSYQGLGALGNAQQLHNLFNLRECMHISVLRDYEQGGGGCLVINRP